MCSGMIDYKTEAFRQRRYVPNQNDLLAPKKKKAKVAEEEEEDLFKVPRVKKAQYHANLNKNEESEQIIFENHILCEDIKKGEVIGARVLLDNQTFKKHISLNSIFFS